MSTMHDTVQRIAMTFEEIASNLRLLCQPCFFMRPRLERRPTGEWIAWIPGADGEMSSVVGRGATPAAALNAFNRAFGIPSGQSDG